MYKGLAKLYLGDFTTMNQDKLSDGSVNIVLSSEHYPEVYSFRVEDLYGENEQVLEHEVVEPDTKPWIKQRMDQAKKQRVGD